MRIKGGISSVSLSSSQDLRNAKDIHRRAVRRWTELDKFTASSLVSMYSKCGSLLDARLLFDGTPNCDAVCWNALILGYAENGEGDEALQLFHRMVSKEGYTAGSHTYVAALQACASLAEHEEKSQTDRKLVPLEKGMAINSRAVNGGFAADMFVSNALVDTYAKCGSMLDARKVFDVMPSHNIVTWTALVLGYAENDEEELALNLFTYMLRTGACRPNALTFVAALKACTGLADKEGVSGGRKVVKLRSLEQSMRIHTEAAKLGCLSNILVTNTLTDTYAHCGSLLDARAVFDRTMYWSVVSWTVLVQGCVDNGLADLGWELFARMNTQPSSRTLIAALQACTSLAAQEVGKEVLGRIVKLASLDKGMRVHSEAIRGGCDRDVFVANTLLDMYASCGSLEDSWRVFCTICRPTVVTWNALIMGYVNNGQAEIGLSLFSEMQRSTDCLPNSLTFVAALRACSSLALREVTAKVDGRDVKLQALHKGIEIHREAKKRGFELDILVANTLVDMYGKCGSMVDALKVFDRIPGPTLVSWTALMLGYVESGAAEIALEVFRSLPPLKPDALAFVAGLKACTSIAAKSVSGAKEKVEKDKALCRGMEIHREAAEAGYGTNVYVSNTLIDMYAKCGRLVNAKAVFDATPISNTVSWNSLILAYVDNDKEEEALQLFHTMQDDESCAPDARSFMAALRACSNLAAREKASELDGKLVKVESLKRGREVHTQATKRSCDNFIFNSLIDMYGKCGSLSEAIAVFNGMQNADVVSWTALISGHVENGEAEVSLELFQLMLAQGCAPNSLTLLAALDACQAKAAVAAGNDVHAIACKLGLETNQLLEGSLVDFYGKTGCIGQAQQVFDSSGGRGLVTWNTLLAAYGRQGNGEQVFSLFHKMEEEGLPADGITLVIVLTLCSHAGLVDRGRKYFGQMWSRFGVSPGLEHYHCMVDMFARANCLEEAVETVRKMPSEGTCVTWITILAACKKWKNVKVARVAFQALQKLDSVEGSAFVLMSDILLDAKEEEEKVVECQR